MNIATVAIHHEDRGAIRPDGAGERDQQSVRGDLRSIVSLLGCQLICWARGTEAETTESDRFLAFSRDPTTDKNNLSVASGPCGTREIRYAHQEGTHRNCGEQLKKETTSDSCGDFFHDPNLIDISRLASGQLWPDARRARLDRVTPTYLQCKAPIPAPRFDETRHAKLCRAIAWRYNMAT